MNFLKEREGMAENCERVAEYELSGSGSAVTLSPVFCGKTSIATITCKSLTITAVNVCEEHRQRMEEALTEEGMIFRTVFI